MIQDSLLDHLVLTDGEVVIRSAHLDDEATLTRWFNDPGVYTYWDGPSPTREYILSHCEVQVSDDTAWPFIVLHRQHPAGFIQAWLKAQGEGGIDLFVAPEFRRKGIGLRAVPMLASYLRDDRGWNRVTVDPHADNTVSRAFFARAGS